MANYIATTRTNIFRVTDEEKYEELFSKLIGESEIEDFSYTEDGKIYHGFGAYCDIDYYDEESDEYDFDKWAKQLQTIIPEKEIFIMISAGSEKLRYIDGYAYLITKDNNEFVSLHDMINHKAKEIFGDNYEINL